MTNPVDERIKDLMLSMSVLSGGAISCEGANINRFKLALLNAVLAVVPERKSEFNAAVDIFRAPNSGYNQAIAEMTDKVKELFK